MLGLSFICNLGGDLKDKKAQYTQSLDTIVCNSEYKSRVLFEDKASILSCTKHDQYPIEVFSNKDFYVCLEGKIYNGKPIDKQLYDLARDLFDNPETAKEKLASWLIETDGDFIVFMLHKPTSRVIIFNDILSRLPVYFHSSGEQFMLSRNFRLISHLMNEKEFDRMAIAQNLLFGYAFICRKTQGPFPTK